MAGRKQASVYLELQPYIDYPPISPEAHYQRACENDGSTVNSWREQWISQYRANHAVFGPFKDRSIGKLYKKHLHQPVFLVGSGPSLKKNAQQLVGDHGIPIISCLHNFHYLEDLGVKVDYYVTLDAGDICIKELSEGGNAETDYWEKTKGKTLLAYVGSHPNLLAKWQGDIYFFNCPIPDAGIEAELDKIERFKALVSSGGNVLGASLYIAKAFLGCSTAIFLGADFSFSYDEKFHAWDSGYDAELGQVVRVKDIYGIPVKTWRSYDNFKHWFCWVAQKVPGVYINCTEGGTLGAYNEGNLRHIIQMDLADCLQQYSICNHMQEQVVDPAAAVTKILF
jgi:hypothetical protein